jgi:transposase
MTTMTPPAPTQVTVGVDTHADVHVAVATDSFGRRLDATSVPTTLAGYAELLAWAQRLGHPDAWGIEGTGSFEAGLTRFLRARGQVVVEVNRPDRAARRRRGKSDPLDAEAAAARAVPAQQGSVPKAGDGQVEMIRSLRVARATAMKARTQAINALKGLLITAAAELREQLRGLSTVRLVQAAGTLEPGPVTTPLAAAKLGLRTLARRLREGKSKKEAIRC